MGCDYYVCFDSFFENGDHVNRNGNENAVKTIARACFIFRPNTTKPKIEKSLIAMSPPTGPSQ